MPVGPSTRLAGADPVAGAASEAGQHHGDRDRGDLAGHAAPGAHKVHLLLDGTETSATAHLSAALETESGILETMAKTAKRKAGNGK